MHPSPPLRRGSGRHQPGDLVDRLRRDVHRGGDEWGQVLLDPVQPGQHGAGVPGLAESQGLGRGGHAQPRGAGRPGLPGARDHPVAVTVGLDHHHDRGRAHVGLQRGDVGPERCQVDLGACGVRVDPGRRRVGQHTPHHRPAPGPFARRCSRPSIAAHALCELLRRNHARLRSRRDRLQRRPELTRVQGTLSSGQQRGADPAEDVARPRLRGPGRTRHRHPNRTLVGSGHQLAGPLEQHGGSGSVDPGPHRPDRVVGHPAALLAQQLGQLAGMRGEQPATRRRRGQVFQAVGVHHGRQALGRRLRQHLGTVGAITPAGAEQVRLHPAGPEDHVGQPALDDLGRPFRPLEADHARAGVDRADDRHHCRARVLVRAGVHPNDAPGVLVARRVGVRPSASQTIGVQAGQQRLDGRGSVQPRGAPPSPPGLEPARCRPR